eukprot:CAMPEP_0179111538 /NCGR_PEP_ID=MMETSP0796-20121207/52099_1 /TAXON_ID=73915 /ORGANISM="Pyrodinium bahamense, Strain pbaha01" /LENGTH=130 /DNA_ID=CAMNT_0020809687 /DNA_START=55 /DNA_END=448 /DNA_ORIENTATION=-
MAGGVPAAPVLADAHAGARRAPTGAADQRLAIPAAAVVQVPAKVLQSRMHVRGAGKPGQYKDIAARDAAIAKAAVPHGLLDRCMAAQSTPGTYISGCSARLEQLRWRRMQLPIAALADAQHAEFMATLVR